MKATQQQIERTSSDWSRISCETIKVEQTGGLLWCHCSEIGSLRLLKEYRFNKGARSEYSINLDTYCFSLELNF